MQLIKTILSVSISKHAYIICILSENMIVSFFFVEKTFPIIIFV